jgi:hypothetical protein
MIGHDTKVRDCIEAIAEVRSHIAIRGAQPRFKPRSDELKRRWDAYEQAQQLKRLIGTDPY